MDKPRYSHTQTETQKKQNLKQTSQESNLKDVEKHNIYINILLLLWFLFYFFVPKKTYV